MALTGEPVKVQVTRVAVARSDFGVDAERKLDSGRERPWRRSRQPRPSVVGTPRLAEAPGKSPAS